MRSAALWLCLCSALAPAASAAGFSDASRGTAAGEFLNLGAGARAAAMGGAYAAVADDANAVYWNPAAMTRVARRSLTLMHAAVLNSGSYEFGAFVDDEGPRVGAFGFGVQYFVPGRIVQTSEAGAYLGNIIPYDMAFTWSYAHELAGWSLGGSAKVVDSRIINSASAGALDLGVLSPALAGDRLRLAFTATNLGGDTMVFDQTGAKLPLALRAGAAYRLLPALLLSADAAFPRSDNPYAALGVEYRIADESGGRFDERRWRFDARGGFSTQTLGSVDGLTGVSMGFGIARGRAGVDYAFAPYGGLGQMHRLSLTCSF